MHAKPGREVGDLVGTCAQHRMPIWIAELAREVIYAHAASEQSARGSSAQEREIPLPAYLEHAVTCWSR